MHHRTLVPRPGTGAGWSAASGAASLLLLALGLLAVRAGRAALRPWAHLLRLGRVDDILVIVALVLVLIVLVLVLELRQRLVVVVVVVEQLFVVVVVIRKLKLQK